MTKRKKTMTPKQIEANRRNAQKSTGPRTEEGKLRSAMNATIHGLTANALILENDPDERIEDFMKLHGELIVSLKPVGQLEQLLVGRIAVGHWRLNRAYRYEARCVFAARKGLVVPASRLPAVGGAADPAAADARPDPASIVLPDAPALDSLLRYEALIDRELNRTLTQLTRVQAARRRSDAQEDDDEEGSLDFATALSHIAQLTGLRPSEPPAEASGRLAASRATPPMEPEAQVEDPPWRARGSSSSACDTVRAPRASDPSASSAPQAVSRKPRAAMEPEAQVEDPPWRARGSSRDDCDTGRAPRAGDHAASSVPHSEFRIPHSVREEKQQICETNPSKLPGDPENDHKPPTPRRRWSAPTG
jgi:hypothetical protein